MAGAGGAEDYHYDRGDELNTSEGGEDCEVEEEKDSGYQEESMNREEDSKAQKSGGVSAWAGMACGRRLTYPMMRR